MDPGPEVFNRWSIVRASLLARVILPVPDWTSALVKIVPLLSVWSRMFPDPLALMPGPPAEPGLTTMFPIRLWSRIGPLTRVVRSSRDWV